MESAKGDATPGSGTGDETSVRLRGAMAGDDADLEWMVAHFHPLVQAQVRLRLGDHGTDHDVHDLADEVWLITLQRLRDLRPAEGRLAPVLSRFLSSTAINLCNNHLRALARRRVAAPAPGPSDVTPFLERIASPHSGVITRATRAGVSEEISRALGWLTPAQRKVVVLRILEGRGNREIAEILGMPPNTVAVTWRRALEALRKTLPPALSLELRRLRRV